MTVQTDWVATLTAQTYTHIDSYLHTPSGFDPLGVLCEMFRHSTYTLLTGQGTVAVGLLQDISDARNLLAQALVNAGVTYPPLAPELATAIAATFWTTDQVTEANKILVKSWTDAIDNEKSAYAVAVLAAPGDQDVIDAHTAYKDTIALWYEWLDTLRSPGGWRLYLNDWETAAWVLDSSRTFYSLHGISTKLPESVQRWAELYEADPIMTLPDSTAGVNAKIPLNHVVDGLVHKIDPAAPLSFGVHHRPYTVEEIIALIEAHLPVMVEISPLNPSINAVSTQQFTATVTHAQNTAVIWTCYGPGHINQSGLYTPGSGAYTDIITATSVEDPSRFARTFLYENGVTPPGGPGGGGGGG